MKKVDVMKECFIKLSNRMKEWEKNFMEENTELAVEGYKFALQDMRIEMNNILQDNGSEYLDFED